MLPVKLVRVIGIMQNADICSIIPEVKLLYKTMPIKSPTDIYKGTNNTLIKIDTEMD